MSLKILTCLAATSLVASCSSLLAAEDVTLDVVTQAWKQTQETVRSATFQWETRKWIAQGAETPPGSAVAQPENEVTLTFDRTLTFSNGKLRYENSGPHWDPRRNERVERREVYTWNDERAIRYTGDRSTPSAWIYGSNIMLTNSELRPIQMMFRMFESSWFLFESQKYEIAPSSYTVDGAECWNVETARRLMREKISKGRKPLKAIFTVCPAREYAVVRYAAMNEATGTPTLEFEFEQARDEETDVWVPSKWTITHYGEQGPFQIETSTVRNYSLNAAVGDDEFALELPTGTLIRDHLAKNGEPESYISRADGQKRAITDEELFRGATHRDLVKTESGMANLRQSEAGGIFSSPATLAWIGGILLLVIAAGLVVRNQQRA